jgi:hypothetical protein
MGEEMEQKWNSKKCLIKAIKILFLKIIKVHLAYIYSAFWPFKNIIPKVKINKSGKIEEIN